jgi:hypothetical protein
LGKLGKEAENEGPVQHWPDKELFGNGWWKSSLQVVRFGFVYASIYLQYDSKHLQSDKQMRLWLIDIGHGGEVLRIASYVDGIFPLVNPDIIHSQMRWKHQVFKVHSTKICRHAQVCNDIL